MLKEITSVVFGKLFGDKGYIIASELFQDLYWHNIHLIAKLRSNMRNKLMHIWDKMLLKKRGIVDSVIGLLKSDYSLEHTRHRSPVNFLASILSSLVAYSFRKKKPSLSVQNTLLSLPF